MPTTSQDNAFAKLMSENIDEVKISSTALDTAIEYIGDNCDPGDVFSEKILQNWAESNGYTKE